MRKRYFLGLLALLLAFSFFFTGCSSDGGGDKKEEEVLDDLSLVGLIDGKLVQTIISKPGTSKAAITPADGYNYVIMYYATKVVISKGTIKYNPPTITFIPENAADEEFTGTYSDGKIQSVDVIIDGETYPMSLGDAEYPDPLVNADPVVFTSANGDGLDPDETADGKFDSTKYSVGDAAAALTVVVSDNHNVTVGTVTRPFAGTLSYQWYKAVDVGGDPGDPGAPGTPEPITGAKAASYTPSTSKAGITWYWVEVTNSMTGYTSVKKPSAAVPIEVVNLEASTTPAYTTALVGASYEKGASNATGTNLSLGTITPAAGPGVVITIKWFKATTQAQADNHSVTTPIPSASSATYPPVIDTVGTSWYYASITNEEDGKVAKTIYSNAAEIEVTLVKVAQPAFGATVLSAADDKTGVTAYKIGDSGVALTVSLGTPPTDGTVKLEWYKTTVATANGALGTKVGTDNSLTYTPFTTAASGDVGDYYILALLTNTPNDPLVNAPNTRESVRVHITVLADSATPSITVQPAGNGAGVGGVVSTTYAMSVTATKTDDGTLTYEWFKVATNTTTGGTSVGTDATYDAPTESSADDSWYYVEVTNTKAGCTPKKATSNAVHVIVT